MNFETKYTLHLVFNPDEWKKAELLATAQDTVLFLQDAVYLLQRPLNCQCEHLFARAKDVKARNIECHSEIEVIDDEQWLEISEHANNIMSW